MGHHCGGRWHPGNTSSPFPRYLSLPSSLVYKKGFQASQIPGISCSSLGEQPCARTPWPSLISLQVGEQNKGLLLSSVTVLKCFVYCTGQPERPVTSVRGWMPGALPASVKRDHLEADVLVMRWLSYPQCLTLTFHQAQCAGLLYCRGRSGSCRSKWSWHKFFN
jgi:hypothetical protein